LQQRAERTPDEVLLRYLPDGEEEGGQLTFAQVDQLARTIAVNLRDVAGPGDRALLLYPPGLDFTPAFLGCLYAGVLAVPTYPPRLDRLVQSWQVLTGIAHDCEPRVVLTTGELAALLGNGRTAPPLDALRWLATDRLDLAAALRWRDPGISLEHTAFLQYTSGSTAAPKGVEITHRNLMHNEHVIETAVEHVGPGLGVCWLPLYHDFGLIAGVLQAIYHGAACVLLSPLHMLQRPSRWLHAVSRYRADTSGGPSFGYDLCVERVSDAEKAALDLGNWSVAGVGAEPVHARTLERFADAFACCGFRPKTFYPCYGLAEGTLFVTGGAKSARPVVLPVNPVELEQGRAVPMEPTAPGARLLVGCGRAWLDQTIAIVDPKSLLSCPDGSVGEIWVQGPSVARGYWNRPELTRATFQARLAGTGAGPFLRTGDLGFVREGELFITGRLKDVLVIRGRNHYPEEIEATVQALNPGLRPGCGAAFEVRQDGPSRVVIVQEVERRCRGLDVAELIGDIREAVAQRHDLQVQDVVFLETGSLPRTSSGKVQRHRCRSEYEQGTLKRWKGPRA
jgi:acyl-CoA synthetase (AMP-forming)/AMP-acid ligase II